MKPLYFLGWFFLYIWVKYKTMNAKQLRVGNYLERYSKVTGERDIIKVGGDTPFLAFESMTSLQFNPIPLTEEWILKFGFEKKGDYWFSKGEHELEWYSGLKVFVYRLKYSANRSFPVREIKYLHQLQNLFFSLCDEELSLIN